MIRAVRYRKLAKLLRAALDAEHGRLSDDQAGTVTEYIDHNEFGLALEQMADSLSELDLMPTPEAKIPMDEAARLMGIDYAARLRP